MNSNTKRLFIASFIDKSLIESKIETIKGEFNKSIFCSWTRFDTAHFTYYFLGDVEINKIRDLKEEMRFAISPIEASLNEIEYSVCGLDAFPNAKSPRVLFAKINFNDNLVFKAQNDLKSIAEHYAEELKKEIFKPHITLCRIKSCDYTKFAESYNTFKNIDFGSSRGLKIELVESRLTPKGPIYRII